MALDLLEKDGIIIVETDKEERELKELEKVQVEVYDLRKYGRVHLLFLNQKEWDWKKFDFSIRYLLQERNETYYGDFYFIRNVRGYAW